MRHHLRPIACALLLLTSGCDTAPPAQEGAPVGVGPDGRPIDPTPVDCAEPSFLPQRLRLLSRREYRNTVRDLLGASLSTCGATADCAFATESCQQGVCAVDPCGTHTFVLDPGGRVLRSVNVAGSFNDWSATGQGGWSMAWSPEAGVWMLKRALPVGQPHQYKFVLDDAEWIRDPSNPEGADDGFGGQNSALTIRCGEEGAGSGDALTAGFPPETRPTGYAFDTHAEAGRVTAIHVDEYMKAAEVLAQRALDDPGAVLPCPLAQADGACFERFVRDFGLRAFRRPPTEGEVARIKALATGQADKGEGLSIALQVILSSPAFLYRSEVGVPAARGFKLTGWEVAAALSYTLWGMTPDKALLDAAAGGALDTPAEIEAQARRMLGMPQSRALIGDFAAQWLGVEKIMSVDKHPALFHDFSREMRQAMLDETRDFVTHVVFDGTHRFDELREADYTLASASLAGFYGLTPAAPGQPVSYGEGRRAGLLGHGSVLATTSHSDQTSPILRGLFVRERLLCQHFGAPPPEAGGVPEVDPGATTRERFRQHSDDEGCRSCHKYIDEPGFGFERFDPVGRWREVEGGQPIDPSGTLIDVEGFGTGGQDRFEDLPGLAAILTRSRAAEVCFVNQVFRFSMGALERREDACAVDPVAQRFIDSGGDILELLVALVTSDHFITRSAP